MKSENAKTHYRVCNFCEAMCGLEVSLTKSCDLDEKDIVVRPDKLDPFSQGSMCPKAPVLGALHTDPSRLRNPVKKVGTEWEEISWNEAYSTIEENLKRIQSESGKDAVASYLGNPIVHNMGMMLFIKTLTNTIGSKNVFSATSMDQLPHHFAAHYMFGHEFRIPVPDVDRTDFMILMGANPIASNGSMMTSAGIRERLGQVKERGGKFVVIDPRKTETASIASAHHFITPGSDVYFLLAFLHELFRNGWVNPDRLAKHLVGLETIETIANCVTPVIAESLTGISADVICKLAEDYAKQEKAVIYGRMGLSTQPHGGLCHWLLNTINIVSGNFDKPGGMMFPTPAIELARGKSANVVGRWTSRVRGMPEFYGELPVSAMTEEMTTPGEGQVRAFMTVCGNPVLSTPGGHRLDAALPNLDFMFSIDNYINETTRHADIILPTPSGLEIEHYDLIFNLISVSNNVKYSEALLPPAANRPYDWQVLKELIKRLADNNGGLFHSLATPRRIINWGLMLGAYGKLSHPSRWFSGLTLNKVIASKHGMSLGPLVSRVPEGVMTSDKKIHLAPQVFIDRAREILKEGGLNAEQILTSERRDAEFALIGRRHVSTNNSWMHQFQKLSVSRQVRCTAMMNPADATRLSLSDGADIKVSSAVGEIVLPVEITDAMMPGVLSIPHGFGHTRSGTRIPHAEAKPGVSVNDITDHNAVDALTGNAAFSGQIVTVERTGPVGDSEDTHFQGKPLLVIYGSRTGNAQHTAQELAISAKHHQLIARVVAMDTISVHELANVERILVLCSTYGEGDMPDNAQSLWDEISVANAPILANTHFSVLAFGDSSYETFCQAGKQFDIKLEALGATRIAERVDCDVDYADAASSWAKVVLPALTDIGDQTLYESDNTQNPESARAKYNRNNPLSVKLLSKRLLTAENSSKETWHVEFTLDDDEVSYVPGDTINVLPTNREDLVHELLAFMQSASTQVLDDDGRTVKERLVHNLELRIPSRALIERITTTSNNTAVKQILNSRDSESIARYLWGKDVLDLLVDNSGVVDSLDELLRLLSPILPRAYSISSSLSMHPSSFHLTVAAVRYESNGRHQHGGGSCFLADLVSDSSTVNVYFAPKSSFILPADDVPIIMIGPGTGVAPFMGFLQERQYRNAQGENWLFFGDRHFATDFLYERELTDHLISGLLTHLDLAFSRDQKEKIYVQDRMRDQGTEIYEWLERGAIIYVCGDAKRMANDVEVALLLIIEKAGDMSVDQAVDYVAKLKSDKRYLRDVY